MEQKGSMIIADYYSHWWAEGTVKFGKSTLSQISIFLFGTCFRISIGTGKGTWFAYGGIAIHATLSPLQSLCRKLALIHKGANNCFVPHSNRHSGMMTEDIWKGLSHCSHSMISEFVWYKRAENNATNRTKFYIFSLMAPRCHLAWATCKTQRAIVK